MQNVSLALVRDDLDPEEAERATRRLRAELADLDLDFVATAGEHAPDGAKGPDAATIGSIVVAMSASGGALTVLIAAVRDWLGRQHRRHRMVVTIDGDSVELDGATPDQQRVLLDHFISRHS